MKLNVYGIPSGTEFTAQLTRPGTRSLISYTICFRVQHSSIPFA